MKVIREASLWRTEQECTGKGHGGYGCTALLEIEESDLYLTSTYDFEGDMEQHFTIKCPCCNIETDLSRNDIPDRVIIKLLEGKSKKLKKQQEMR